MQIKGVDLLQQLFQGDDDISTSENAFLRAMRSRKWLILSAALLVAASLGTYREEGFKNVVEVFSMPREILFRAALFGTLYLGTQYLIQVWQLVSVYPALFRERLFTEHRNKLDELQDKRLGYRF